MDEIGIEIEREPEEGEPGEEDVLADQWWPGLLLSLQERGNGGVTLRGFAV